MSDSMSPFPSESAAPEPVDEVVEENVEEGAELEAAAEPVEPKVEEKKANKRKFKLKVDGRDFEEEVDLDNDEYLTKQLQLAKASQKRMSEFSQLQKEVGQFLADLKKNPRKVLSDPRIGLDVKQLAAEIIEEEISNSQKSPEQIEKEKLEMRLRELEDERKTEKEESRKQEFDRIQQQEFERYDTMMTKTLEKSDLPKSPYIIKKMADYMLMGLNQGLDVTPEDVLPLVREEMQNDLKEMFAVMPEDVIESIIGKDVISRLRKKNIAKAKAAPPQPLKSQLKDSGQKTDKSEDKSPKQSYKDFFNF